jgi:hypothetical protein
MVNKVELVAAETRVTRIQRANFDVGRHIDQKPAIHVGGNDRSRTADPVSEPTGYRPGTGTQFEAAPPALYRHSLLQQRASILVPDSLQGTQSRELFIVGKRVPDPRGRLFRHSSPFLVRITSAVSGSGERRRAGRRLDCRVDAARFTVLPIFPIARRAVRYPGSALDSLSLMAFGRTRS